LPRRPAELDPTCIRGYLHLSDLADHVAAIDWLATGKSSNFFSLGMAAVAGLKCYRPLLRSFACSIHFKRY
jgi:hypothetical protein